MSSYSVSLGIFSAMVRKTFTKSNSYMLYHEGYDVWLGNFRGSFYSRKHKTLKPSSNKFWDWSYHEMAIYDVPSMVNFVIENTQVDKIGYIGHSMSSTTAVIYASLKPEHAEKYINNFILISPAIYFNHTKSPLVKLAPASEVYYAIQKKLHNLEFLPHNKLTENLSKICYKTAIGMKMCATIIQILFGEDWQGFDPSIMPVMATQNPAGLSLKCINHYAQNINSGNFNYYDYGKKKNQKLYQSHYPPKYPIENITSALYLIVGGRDILVTFEDVQQFFNNLSKETKAKSKLEVVESYNHIDFAYSKYVATMANGPLIKFLNNFNG